jgi:hypothetical protein
VAHSNPSESLQELFIAALEAESGALRTLEVALALAVDREEEQRLQARVVPALESLRAALAELRSFAAPRPVSAGFVLPGPASVESEAGGPDPESPLEAEIAKIAWG